jgi:hypothetical protein
MSSPQMIRTFGLSLTGWPFAVEAPMPRTRAPADTGAYWAPLRDPRLCFRRHHGLPACKYRQLREPPPIVRPPAAQRTRGSAALAHRRRRPGIRALPVPDRRVAAGRDPGRQGRHPTLTELPRGSHAWPSHWYSPATARCASMTPTRWVRASQGRAPPHPAATCDLTRFHPRAVETTSGSC